MSGRAPRARRARETSGGVRDEQDTGIGTRHEDASASPGFVLWQVAMVWQRAVRTALVDVDLTHAQFVLLASAGWLADRAVHHGGAPVTQALVATHARTDAVMTSEVLRTLERKHLVRRHPHPTDARAKCIALTAAGRRVVRRAIELVEGVDDVFFGAPGAELRALATILCGHRPGA